MAGVQYDSYRRGALRRRPESVSALHFLLMFVAAGLLILSRVEHPVSAVAPPPVTPSTLRNLLRFIPSDKVAPF